MVNIIENLHENKSDLSKNNIVWRKGGDMEDYENFEINKKEFEVFNKLSSLLQELTSKNVAYKKVDCYSDRIKEVLKDSEEISVALKGGNASYIAVLKDWLDKYDEYDIDQNGDDKRYTIYLKDGEIWLKERTAWNKRFDNAKVNARKGILGVFLSLVNTNAASL